MGPIYGVAFNPEGSLIATVGGTPSWINSAADDYEIALWEVANLDQPPRLIEGHEAFITDVAFDPTGRGLVTTSWDNTVRIWDLQRSDRQAEVLYGHEAYVSQVVISPDGGRIFTGSGDHSVRIWNFRFPYGAPFILRRTPDSIKCNRDG